MKELLFLASMSGAGRTSASQTLIEEEYVILENLEIEIIKKTVALINESDEAQKIALISHIRNERKTHEILDYLKTQEENFIVKKILLSADNDVLVNRYKELRKIHPLLKKNKKMTLDDAIKTEVDTVQNLFETFDRVMDTTNLAVRDMQLSLKEFLNGEMEGLRIVLQSFGYKYGLPQDSDNVIDVRYLPNPFYVQNLRSKTGLDKEVRDYVMSFDESQKAFEIIMRYIENQIKGYRNEKRLLATFSIGCTGGKHRSVTFVEMLSKEFENVTVKHLEQGRNHWK